MKKHKGNLMLVSTPPSTTQKRKPPRFFKISSGKLSYIVADDTMRQASEMLAEVFCLDAMPTEVADYLLRHRADELLLAVYGMLKKYEDYNLVYLPDGKEMPKRNSASFWIYLDPKFCLINRESNRGFGDFPEEITEVPPEQEAAAHKAFVGFIRQKLRESNI